MSSNHQSEPDSTPPIESNHPSTHEQQSQSRVRFMCSFNGKILPRPHDNQLRYIGGDTRIVAVNRHNTTFSALLNKLSKLYTTTKRGTTNTSHSSIVIKYQLPNEDLDSLITVSSDEDVENMMEEYDRLVNSLAGKDNRIRIFLFPASDIESRASGMSSLLDGLVGHESWFLDALNSSVASNLDRGRSEASSMVSEVPDYLFGFDNSEESHQVPLCDAVPVKNHRGDHLTDYVSGSDHGSPKIVQSITSDLAPLKINRDDPTHLVAPYENLPMLNFHPVSHFPGPPIPMYHMPGPGQQVPIQAQYVHQFHGRPSQVPVQFHQQVYNPPMRPVGGLDPYNVAPRAVHDGFNQQAYFGFKGAPMVVPTYPGTIVSSGDGSGVTGSSDGKNCGL